MATEPQAAAGAAPSAAPTQPVNNTPTMIPPTRVEVDPNSPPQAPTPKADPNRPGWLPEKFKSPEDLATAYKELEKRLGGKPTEPVKAPEAKPTEAPKTKDELTIEAAEKVAEDKGIDLAAYQTEFESAGKLSDKSYESLAAKGIPKDVVDSYIAGRQALQERTVAEMTKDVGGVEGYQQMAQWAAQNVPKDELAAFNKIVVEGTDPAAAKIAIAGLHAKFKAAQEPGFFRTGEQPNVKGDVYRSTAEITQAINDPRYKKDPAYRQDVEQRIMRSNII